MSSLTAPAGPVRATAPGPRRPDSAGMARAARQRPVEITQLARHAPCGPRFGRRCWLGGERPRAPAPWSGTGCGGYLMTILVRGPIAAPAMTALVHSSPQGARPAGPLAAVRFLALAPRPADSAVRGLPGITA